eukprot:m.440665 g.440665  ORF g.440665 m.440665 type:complete len:302 (-) comp20279_c1_seq1:66-971(-)
MDGKNPHYTKMRRQATVAALAALTGGRLRKEAVYGKIRVAKPANAKGLKIFLDKDKRTRRIARVRRQHGAPTGTKPAGVRVFEKKPSNAAGSLPTGQWVQARSVVRTRRGDPVMHILFPAGTVVATKAPAKSRDSFWLCLLTEHVLGKTHDDGLELDSSYVQGTWLELDEATMTYYEGDRLEKQDPTIIICAVHMEPAEHQRQRLPDEQAEHVLSVLDELASAAKQAEQLLRNLQRNRNKEDTQYNAPRQRVPGRKPGARSVTQFQNQSSTRGTKKHRTTTTKRTTGTRTTETTRKRAAKT